MFPGPASMGFVWGGVERVLSSHLCYVGGFGDLGEPVLPTLRGGGSVGSKSIGNTMRRRKIFFPSYWNCDSFSAIMVWCNPPTPPPLGGGGHHYDIEEEISSRGEGRVSQPSGCVPTSEEGAD